MIVGFFICIVGFLSWVCGADMDGRGGYVYRWGGVMLFLGGFAAMVLAAGAP